MDINSETLLAVAEANHFSTKSHVPRTAFTCRFRKDRRGDVKRALKNISRSGYVIKHPTRGEITWQLTKLGLASAKSLAHR